MRAALCSSSARIVGRVLSAWVSASHLRAAAVLAWGMLVVALHGTRPVQAQPHSQGYSSYERAIIGDALAQLRLTAAQAPEGRRIGHIHLVRLEVFEPRDPVPSFLNVFHTRTRPRIILSELLFERGDLFDWERLEESARSLRTREQLSVVLVIPVDGTSPDTVDVLVITKDVWSLRLNWSAEVLNDGLTALTVQPSETNLAGTHALIGGLFTLEPDVYSFGGFLSQSNIEGSRLTFSVNAGTILNRSTDAREGSFGLFRYGLPLYSLSARWGWLVHVQWLTEVDRLYNGMEQAWFDAREISEGDPCGVGIDQCIPYEYHSDSWIGAYELTRSYGSVVKVDASLGAEVASRRYSVVARDGVSTDALARFRRQELPISDRRVSPFVQLRTFEARYTSILDHSTLGLQEDVQLGYDAILRMYTALESMASSRDLLGSRAAASFTAVPGHGVVRVLGTNDMQVSGPGESDARLTVRVHAATPPTFAGRLVFDGLVSTKYRDYFNTKLRLGGNTRLRGYAPDEFIGKDTASSNLEFRTRPVEVLSALIGGAVFWDVGDAVDGFDQLALKQAVGAGIRLLFPQLDRAVFRADWGIPLVDPLASQVARSAPTSRSSFSSLPGQLYVSFEQAFGMPSIVPELSTRIRTATE